MLVKAVFVVVVLLVAITGIYFLFEKFFGNNQKMTQMQKDMQDLKKSSCSGSCECSKEKTDGNSTQK